MNILKCDWENDVQGEILGCLATHWFRWAHKSGGYKVISLCDKHYGQIKSNDEYSIKVIIPSHKFVL